MQVEAVVVVTVVVQVVLVVVEIETIVVQANTGGGGGGRTGGSGNGGSGGSGIVILRYPTAAGTISVGAGLTSSTSTIGSDTIVSITAGTGNVSWS